MSKSQSGLTLLELTVWVLLVAILSVLAAPKYVEMTRAQTPASVVHGSHS